MEQLLTYALFANELKHISEVKNGLACNCVCPSCKHPLVAKNNPTNQKISHFAHHSGKECEGAIESTLHLLAKSVLLKTKQLTTPRYHFDYNPENEKSYFRPTRQLTFDNIILERIIEVNGETIIPDAIGEINGREVYIEFANTHFIDENKKKKLKLMGVACIEVNLKGQALDENSLADFYNSDTALKYWILNTKYDNEYKEYRIQAHKEKEKIEQEQKYKDEQERILNDNKIIKYKNTKGYKVLKADDWGVVAHCPMKRVELQKMSTSNFYRHPIVKQIIDGANWNGEFYGRIPNGRFIYVNNEKKVIYPPDNIPVTDKDIKNNKYFHAGLLELLPIINNPKFGECKQCPYFVDNYYLSDKDYNVCKFS